jgi:hypothetical protein
VGRREGVRGVGRRKRRGWMGEEGHIWEGEGRREDSGNG